MKVILPPQTHEAKAANPPTSQPKPPYGTSDAMKAIPKVLQAIGIMLTESAERTLSIGFNYTVKAKKDGSVEVVVKTNVIEKKDESAS